MYNRHILLGLLFVSLWQMDIDVDGMELGNGNFTAPQPSILMLSDHLHLTTQKANET